MKRILSRIVGTTILVALAFLIGTLSYSWVVLHQPFDRSGETVRCEIPAGISVDQIHEQMVQKGLIHSRVPWVIYVRLSGKDRSIKSGLYDLSTSMSPVTILDNLVRGVGVLSVVTIPEGWTAATTFGRLAARLKIPEGQFFDLAADISWRKSLNLPETGLEGYLYPETYQFARGVTARTVLETLLEAARRSATPEEIQTASALDLSWHQLITLASIIEAEARIPSERSRIAAVYHNRLAAGWLLQADPTVAYASGVNGSDLTHRELAIDSPYNTYVYKGLPPGPICSPGADCIRAALNPDASCRDFYFVARGDGSHIFSRTLAEHNRARIQVARGKED